MTQAERSCSRASQRLNRHLPYFSAIFEKAEIHLAPGLAPLVDSILRWVFPDCPDYSTIRVSDLGDCPRTNRANFGPGRRATPIWEGIFGWPVAPSRPPVSARLGPGRRGPPGHGHAGPLRQQFWPSRRDARRKWEISAARTRSKGLAIFIASSLIIRLLFDYGKRLLLPSNLGR